MYNVKPETGADEVLIGANQTDQYIPLHGALYRDNDGTRHVATRWRLTEDERQRLIQGEDLYLIVATHDQPFQPVRLQVGPDGLLVGDATGI
jgi:hypothetical protein